MKALKWSRRIVLAAVALIVAVWVIYLFVWGRPTAYRNRCYVNLLQIDGAVMSYSLENRLYVGDPVPLDKVAEYLIWNRLPICPSGGHYIVALIGDTPVCSYHGDLVKQLYPVSDVYVSGSEKLSTNVPAKWFLFREVPSPAFSADDLVNLAALVRKLKQPARTVDIYVSGQLSPVTVEALARHQGASSDPALLQASLLQDLNKLIRGPLIYDAHRFAGVGLRKETDLRLYYIPQGDALVGLNRLLLEDAYPAELSKAPRSPER